MQTLCTSLQTDNHTDTSSLNFYRPDALPVKALKAKQQYKMWKKKHKHEGREQTEV